MSSGRYFRTVTRAAIAAMIAAGCGGESFREPGAPISTVEGPEKAGVQRFVPAYFEQLRLHPPEAWELPLDSGWTITGASDVRYEKGVLSFQPEAEKSFLERDIDISAAFYNCLEVTSSTSGGSECMMRWRSDIDPEFREGAQVTGKLVSDGQFHTCSIPLCVDRPSGFTGQERPAGYWAGRIKGIALSLGDSRARVAIRRMRLLHDPALPPPRIRIRGETCEALFGSLPLWRAVIPAHAVLEVHLGVLHQVWRDAKGEGVRFVITIIDQGGEKHRVLDERLDPLGTRLHRQWQLRQLGLGPFAGQRVGIRFTVDHLGDPVRDYAFWGNPMIFVRPGEHAPSPVLLISCDTTNAGHLSCYGYERITTPHLDAFASDAVLFEEAYAPITWTLPSHISMMTGLYPKEHRVDLASALPEDVPRLAESLHNADYVTAAFTGFTVNLDPARGFGKGFDVYNIPHPTQGLFYFRDVASTHRLAETWLDTHSGAPFFLFLHNFDIHSREPTAHSYLPYYPEDPQYRRFSNEFDPPPELPRKGSDLPVGDEIFQAFNRGERPISAEERAYFIALYDDAILSVDAALGTLFASLRNRGLYDRALIIVTSDHGEEFGEHEYYKHETVYRGCARVPLLIKFPQNRFSGRRVAEVVELIDIYPTVLDVLRLPEEEGVSGQSLLPFLEGTGTLTNLAFTEYYGQHAVRNAEESLVRHPGADTCELYRYREDPGEQHDRFQAEVETVPALSRALDEFFPLVQGGWHFRWLPGGAPIRSLLRVWTGDVFRSRKVWRSDEPGWEPTDFEWHRFDEKVEERIVVDTASPEAQVHVLFRTDTPVYLAVGGEGKKVKGRHRLTLNPQQGEYEASEWQAPEGDRIPQLHIWRVATEAQARVEMPLTQEEREALQGLGYLD